MLSQQLGGISTQAGQFGLGLAGIEAGRSAFGDIAEAQQLGTVTATSPGFGDILGGVSGGLGALSELEKETLKREAGDLPHRILLEANEDPRHDERQ